MVNKRIKSWRLNFFVIGMQCWLTFGLTHSLKNTTTTTTKKPKTNKKETKKKNQTNILCRKIIMLRIHFEGFKYRKGFVYWHINLCGLFNVSVIPIKEKGVALFDALLKYKEAYIFLKSIFRKLNAMTPVTFERPYYDILVSTLATKPPGVHWMTLCGLWK